MEEGDHARFLTKGALAELLEVCASVRDGAEPVPLTASRKAALEARMAGWGAAGLRVLGVATRTAPHKAHYARDEEQGLTFEGYLLLEDRPKQGVERVLGELRDLGVRVKIITGDNRYVARHVARSVALYGDTLLTGAELAEMTDEALWHRAGKVSIFAEIDPNQKARIITALRKTGHVVGYLGDGINDAPALHAADVGLSVDTAADVVRETADMVLLEPDLDVLRQGILLGRRTFANTLKYVYITTSANFGNMVSMAVASLFLPFLPLLPTQILLNNFLSDVPAVGLAGDRVDQTWLERPRRWQIRPIQHFMIVFGLVSSLFDFLTFASCSSSLPRVRSSSAPAGSCCHLLTELVVILILRTRAPWYRSRPSSALALSAAATGAVALALPFTVLGAAFQFAPLPPELLGTLLLLTVGYALATEAAKRWF